MWSVFLKQKQLPLLCTASRLFGNSRLDDMILISCQHILGSTYDMFEVLFSHGLKPENTYLLGKCYSTSRSVYRKFQRRGVRISPLSFEYDSHLSFDEQFSLYVAQFMQQITKERELRADQPIIILDDGAELLLYANDFFSGFTRLAGVEQTSSGYRKIANSKPYFPIVNIARSEAKLNLESPFIAEAFVAKLRQRIKFSRDKQHNVLVVGQGPIGQVVASQLSPYCQIETYDLSSHGNRFPGSYEPKLNTFDVIVGATGQSILEPGEFDSVGAGTILTSISSSDREFSAVHLRRLAKYSRNCHNDIEVNGIKLLNSGFPLNFDGNVHSVAPEKIQLTRALLLAGVFTAAETAATQGLINLDHKIEQRLVSEFVEYGKVRNEK